MEEKLYFIKKALLSVYDKNGLLPVAHALMNKGVEIYASGGTYRYLVDQKIVVTPVQTLTKNPEAFGGRMKTISFQIGSGLLYQREKVEDCHEAKTLGIEAIDLVICNFYPFKEVAKKNYSLESDLIEQIDIGGPMMVRAAAKNSQAVMVLTDPGQYQDFLFEFEQFQGATSLKLRQHFALWAFQQTSEYDQMVSQELMKRWMPETTTLRYGENPHQNAHFFPHLKEKKSFAHSEILGGKALSYNNWLDAEAAWKVASELNNTCNNFKNYSVVIVKHANPCGAAMAFDQVQALQWAWQADAVSAFGSVICFDQPLTIDSAKWLAEKFIEIVIAPDYSAEALKILQNKKNLRILKTALKKSHENETVMRSIHGALLMQAEDEGEDNEFQVVTKKPFLKELFPLAHFGLAINKYLKSNAISLVKEMNPHEYLMLGAGMGQPNRIDSITRLAIPRAKNFFGPDCLKDQKVILISDAFFPFPDSITVCHDHGIHSIVQPGGSIKDPEVIAECDRLNIAMALTHRRHFRH